MRYLTAIIGLFLVLALPYDTAAVSGGSSVAKRSISLDDVYHYNLHRHRLPSEVIPTSYELELLPFIGNDKFQGRVKINVTWKGSSDMITFNARPELRIWSYNVKITELSFLEREKGLPMLNVNVARVDLPDERKPWYTIHLEQMLMAGSSCEVELYFSGNLSIGSTTGLFRNHYTDEDGNTHSYIGTNFRLDHAQSVFPCMDEPLYKANFKLSVLRPQNMTALSNMPLKATTKFPRTPMSVNLPPAALENVTWDHFKMTPKISTYQLALLVSNFESISPTLEVNEMDGRRLDIKIWAPKGYLNTLKDVPDRIVKLMNYLQEYFNSSIGLPKLDVVATHWTSSDKPADNWGLMLFASCDLTGGTIWNVAYELIYQWIGQYITPFRWTDAPVSKALNSFLASMTTVELNPDEMEGKWPMTMLYSLYYEFGKFEPFWRVGGMRDEATSSKTELVFRMFNYTLGKELFQKGVRNFVRQESEGNLRTFFADDIYSRFNDVVNGTGILPEGLTINTIAGLWTNRDRVPLVTVIRDYERKTITFSQKVYLRETPRETTPKVSYQWDIPIVMTSQEKLEFQNQHPLWLTKKNKPENLTIPDITDADHFIIVNPEEIGMFPVNYDSCNWKMLSQYLQGPEREKIPILTRAKLLHDSWNLAYSGELCFGIALNMTLFLNEERSHVVWEPVFMMIDHIGRCIDGSDVYPKFEAYTRTLLKSLYEELKETADSNEPSWKTHMRGMAKNFLCRAGYEPCVAEARDQFKKWIMDEDPDKGNPVANEFLCPVFKWGTEEEWEFGLQRVINFPQGSPERKQNERTYLLKSLAGCPKDSYKIERLLNATILDPYGNFTIQDIQLILVTLSGGVASYRTLLYFLVGNWDAVKQKFEYYPQMWDRIEELAFSLFSIHKDLDIVKKLYERHPEEFDRPDRLVQVACTVGRKEWAEKNLPVLDAWLSENLPKEELEAIQFNIPTTTMTSNME